MGEIICLYDFKRSLPRTVLRPSKFYRMFLHDYERDAIDAFLHRHERVLGVDAVRVEHVRVAAHRREEHVLQYGRRQ